MCGSLIEYHCLMRKFTDEQVEHLRLILEKEYDQEISIETAALVAHNLYELYDVLTNIARKLVQ